jgi:hypothetical protein
MSISNSLYREFNNIKNNTPHALWQPSDHIRYERLTGRSYMSDEWMSAYPNPYNKENPKNKYITIDFNHASDLLLQEDKRKEKNDREIKDINIEIKYEKQQGTLEDNITCLSCNAINSNNVVHCFYCGQLIGLSRYYKKVYGYRKV